MAWTNGCPPKVRAKIAATAKARRSNSDYRHKLNTEPSYHAIHQRLRTHLARISCALCGATGRLEAALKHEAPAENIRHDERYTWSVRMEDYFTLCRRCHTRYDDIQAKMWATRRRRTDAVAGP